jgi:glycosyltransferase involved in cell wall biosynthesis
MSKSSLLRILTEPLTGRARRQIKTIRNHVLNSRAVRIFFMTTNEAQGKSDYTVPKESLSTRIAYALPRHKILWEDECLQAANRYTRQILGLPLFACLYWVETIGVQVRMPLPLRLNNYQRWWEIHGPPHFLIAERLLLEAEAERVSKLPGRRFDEKPFGVNLIGHAFSVFGLGEFIRMTAKALEAGGIPFSVIDIPVGNGAPSTDRSLASQTLSLAEDGPYAFNLYCMTADAQIHLALEEGLGRYEQHYSLVAWLWELERWPSRLVDALELADECWPCSRIIEQSLKGACASRQQQCQKHRTASVPINPMPPVVDFGDVVLPMMESGRAAARGSFGLDPDAVLFAFGFDLNSMIARKNPQAVIQAFQQAFHDSPGSDYRVGLVIKSFPPRSPEPRWDELKSIASADPRITIIEADLDREGILTLYGCCDVFVSLHRSEGLGMGLAEALQLGLDVIATNYGGNADFCTGPLAHPIDYQLIPVKQGEYPHHEEMVWAEPNLQQAIAVMREVAQKRHNSPVTDPEVISEYKRRFSAETVGAHYRERLVELWESRLQIQEMIDRRNRQVPLEITAPKAAWQR